MPGVRDVPEINEAGDPEPRPCFNHPDYLKFVLAQWEEILTLHPGLDGIKYGQERADGLLLSREYDEMQVHHLKAAGRAVADHRAKPGMG